MVHYDFYSGEPISGSPDYLSQYESGTNMDQGIYYSNPISMNPPQGFSYDPNSRFNTMEQSYPYQQTPFPNPAIGLMQNNQHMMYQQQPQEDQIVHVEGYHPGNSVYLYPSDIVQQLEKLEQDMFTEMVEEEEELQSRYQGYFNNNPGYNYYNMSYLGGYYGGANIQRKYQDKLNQIQQEAIERRNKLNITLSKICHRMAHDGVTDEQIEALYNGYTYTVPTRNIQEESKMEYLSRLQPCSNAGFYQQQELQYREYMARFIKPDATLEEFSDQVNDYIRECDYQEEMHRRRNGSRYFQEDGYHRILRNSIIRRKREREQENGIEPIGQGPNPYFNQQQSQSYIPAENLIPLIDGMSVTDDGTLSISAPNFNDPQVQANIQYRQHATDELQANYEQNRQRFLQSIYNTGGG